ncbi:MAG: hypothetical protein ACLRQY_09295, partial [[Clostridium] leptum]
SVGAETNGKNRTAYPKVDNSVQAMKLYHFRVGLASHTLRVVFVLCTKQATEVVNSWKIK